MLCREHTGPVDPGFPMPYKIDVQIATEYPQLPTAAELTDWVTAALAGRREKATLTIRLVDDAEGAQLNRRWRSASGPTNVLSFSSEGLTGIAPDLLGDVVVCAPLAAREAAEQGKPPSAHWAHLIVHGILHLIGFDHERARDAERMESLERTILADLGYADPYESDTWA